MIGIALFVEPVRRSVVLACSPAEAFRAFTEDIGEWWPLATHSVHPGRASTCRFSDGRLIEIRNDGLEDVWAEVAAWEPGVRLLLRWHPGLPGSEAQDVEITFRAAESGTLVELEHRDWQQNPSSKTRRDQDEGGWTGVLRLYAESQAGRR
jgi:uncharacterized protein YndB with AHSA1/START domain